jgi:hypothetical protein
MGSIASERAGALSGARGHALGAILSPTCHLGRWRVHRLPPDANPRTDAHALQQEQEMHAPQGDAALGWAISGPGQMHEHRAACPAHARSHVVAEHDDKVVEAVLPPQPLGARRIGMPDGAVVVAIGGRIAPPVSGRDRPYRQRRRRTPAAVAAVEHGRQAPAPDRRGAVAFALAHAAAAATERAGKRQAAKLDGPAGCSSRQTHDRGRPRASSARGGAQSSGHFLGDWAGRPGICFTRHRNARLPRPWKQSAPGAKVI